MKVKKISEKEIEFNGVIYIAKELIDNSIWIKIPELGIEVEKEVHDKNKSWNELGLKDREKELLTAEQCIWLANSKYAEILKMDGSSSSDDFFIQQSFNLNRKNGYIAWFYAGSDRASLGFGWVASVSNGTLGVRFVRPLKKEKK